MSARGRAAGPGPAAGARARAAQLVAATETHWSGPCGNPLSKCGWSGTDRVRTCWRDELPDRAWGALAALELEGGRPLHTVLKLRATHPKVSSSELAALAAARLGKPVTPAGVRQTLHRAREKFAEQLLDAVADTLEAPTRDRLGEELEELGLLGYCKPALDRWGPG